MGFKVLIADDEKDIVEMLSAFFTGKGYDILTAYNGEEILGKIENRPDIILLDVNMPGMDGERSHIPWYIMDATYLLRR